MLKFSELYMVFDRFYPYFILTYPTRSTPKVTVIQVIFGSDFRHNAKQQALSRKWLRICFVYSYTGTSLM